MTSLPRYYDVTNPATIAMLLFSISISFVIIFSLRLILLTVSVGGFCELVLDGVITWVVQPNICSICPCYFYISSRSGVRRLDPGYVDIDTFTLVVLGDNRV